MSGTTLKEKLAEYYQPWKLKLIAFCAFIGSILRVGDMSTAGVIGEFVGVFIALTVYVGIATVLYRGAGRIVGRVRGSSKSG